MTGAGPVRFRRDRPALNEILAMVVAVAALALR
jgi:hypothetical protein